MRHTSDRFEMANAWHSNLPADKHTYIEVFSTYLYENG
jgi:hypothetical protein